MGSVVRELQRDALDVTVPVSSILRKALVVARKLAIKDFRMWCENELNGYQGETEIPDYRVVNVDLKAQNPFRGLIPVIQPPDMAETFSHKAIGQPIAELEDVTNTPIDKDGFLTVQIPKSIEATLVKMLSGMYPVLIVNRTEIRGILDSVRNLVLDWALKLEEQGILGEDMAFSEKEKQTAPSVVYNIGQMTQSQIQHDTVGSNQSMTTSGVDLKEVLAFIDTLKRSTSELSLEATKQAELESEIKTVEAQSKSPKPKGRIIKESLTSIRTILEGAAGSILASKLLEQLPALIQMFGKM